MKFRAYLVLLAFLLFCSISYSLNPFLVVEANYGLLNEHVIDVSEGNVSDLHLSMSVPIGSQVVLSSHNFELQRDEFSNPSLYVYDKSPQIPFNFSAYLKVSSTATYTNSLEPDFEVPDNYLIFLNPTDDVPSDNEQISKIASDITANYSSHFEKISALAYWVHNYIGYNLSYASKNQSVYDILNQKRGVCGDYALLFATLARSLGYPTRFVNGYAYSYVQGQWVGHAWNEVYIGKWVPVDPTWLEVGAIDATHVPVSRINENKYSLASVSALVYPQEARLFWRGDEQFRSSPANNLQVENTRSIEKSTDFDVGISHEKISQNRKFLVYLKYPAKDYRILRAYLSPCVSDSGDVIEFEKKELWVATEPSQDSYLIWEGKSVSKIAQNVRYSCPLTISSDYLEKRTVDVEIQFSEDEPEPIFAAAKYSQLNPGEAQSITIEGAHNSQTAYLLSSGFFEKKKLDENGMATFEFSPSKPGQKIAYVWSENSEPLPVSYEVLKSKEKSMFEISLQDVYMQGEQSYVNIVFDPQLNSSLSDKFITWSWANQSSQISLEDIDSNNITIPFEPDVFGNYIFSVSLLDSNMQKIYSQSKTLQAHQKSFVSVNMLRITKLNENVSIARLMLNTSGPVEDIWVLVDGKKYLLASNEIQLDLLPKSYDAKVIWRDSTGQENEIPVFIRAPTEGDKALEIAPGVLIRKQNINVATIIGQGAAAILVLSIIVFISRRHHANPFA